MHDVFFHDKLVNSSDNKLKIEKINLSTEIYFYYFINKTERFTDVTIEGTRLNFPKVKKNYFFYFYLFYY